MFRNKLRKYYAPTTCMSNPQLPDTIQVSVLQDMVFTAPIFRFQVMIDPRMIEDPDRWVRYCAEKFELLLRGEIDEARTKIDEVGKWRT